jgi:hypothetical protein
LPFGTDQQKPAPGALLRHLGADAVFPIPVSKICSGRNIRSGR